ncbi:MAG: cation transporter [Candidatus Faecousia sp.]|nr:cation transporter [Candidatus Faecousia sp.]
MVKTTLKIDAMACGMCEAHVNDAIRKAFSVKKVSSSHAKGRTEILSDLPLEEPRLKAAVEASGYRVTSIQSEPYERKGFFLFKK